MASVGSGAAACGSGRNAEAGRSQSSSVSHGRSAVLLQVPAPVGSVASGTSVASRSGSGSGSGSAESRTGVSRFGVVERSRRPIRCCRPVSVSWMGSAGPSVSVSSGSAGSSTGIACSWVSGASSSSQSLVVVVSSSSSGSSCQLTWHPLLILPRRSSVQASARRCWKVRVSPGTAMAARASRTWLMASASAEAIAACRKLMPSMSGRMETYRSSRDRRSRSLVWSGSTMATNSFSQRPSSSTVLCLATSTTRALNSCLEVSRVSRMRALLIRAARSWSMCPACQASQASGVSSWSRRAMPMVREILCLLVLVARPISRAANSPGV